MRSLTQSIHHSTPPQTGRPHAPANHPVPERLPVGLSFAVLREPAHRLDLTLPAFEGAGMVLSFLDFKGDIQVFAGSPRKKLEQAQPGMAIMSAAGRPLHVKSSSVTDFSAVVLFIPGEWIGDYMKDNENFSKIEMMLESEETGITCRLGRRQMSLLSSILAVDPTQRENLLGIQNHVLTLLEFFLCNRHKSLLSPKSTGIVENEEDLHLIREVESYIAEYYCSDTFTVDSILKKTYTSYHKLNFLFKSIHGMTISEYIRNKRIERSKEMIADNVKSISQIAYEIGYSSISNYILAFKKVYQITPGKYKKQMES